MVDVSAGTHSVLSLAAQLGWTLADAYRSALRSPPPVPKEEPPAQGVTTILLGVTGAKPARPQSAGAELAVAGLSASVDLGPADSARARARLVNALSLRLERAIVGGLDLPSGDDVETERDEHRERLGGRRAADGVTFSPWGRPTGLPDAAEDADTLREHDVELRVWLTVLNDRTALEAYLLGQQMSDLIATPADRLDDAWRDTAVLTERLEGLAELMPAGSGAALLGSVRRWTKECHGAGAVRRAALVELAAPRTSRMWQLILFGHGLPIAADQEEVVADLAEEVPWGVILLVAAAVLLVVLLGAVAVYALVGTGMWWERLAAGVIGAGGIAIAAWSGLIGWIRAAWNSTVGAWLTAKRIGEFYTLRLERAFADVDESARRARAGSGPPPEA